MAELSALIRHRVISCSELTELSLKRLKQLGPKLSCVISLTETRARETAAARDRELDEGIYRGPLHGIPYGAKDLLATAGDLTTWGARPFEHQRTESDARVVTLLEEAGAILVAKLSLGALAWGMFGLVAPPRILGIWNKVPVGPRQDPQRPPQPGLCHSP